MRIGHKYFSGEKSRDQEYFFAKKFPDHTSRRRAPVLRLGPTPSSPRLGAVAPVSFDSPRKAYPCFASPAQNTKTGLQSRFLYFVRVRRIELLPIDWQPNVLPLNYTRNS
jgi:hypothetical protein